MQMLPLLCFALNLGAAQTPAPAKVNFSEPAAPLSRLMPVLAVATGLPLKVSQAMQTEVMCVSVHDVSPQDLLTKLAAASGGQWTQSDNSYYLSPSNAGREALKQRALAARRVRFAADLRKLDPANAPAKPKGSDAQPDFASMMQPHGDPVFFQLLSAIGPNQLASLQPGDRVVLSNRPTARQYALPPCEEMIASYIARHNAEVDKRSAAKGSQSDDSSDVPDGAAGDRISALPSKVDLILTRAEGMGAFIGAGELGADLVLYDAAGKEIQRDRGTLGSVMDPDEVSEMMAQATGKGKPAGTSEAPVTVSADTQQFMKFVRNMQRGLGGANGSTMSAEARQQTLDRLCRPDLHDPLAYPADLLQGYAKAKNLQLVASLPDSFVTWLISVLLGTPTPSAIARKLAHDTNLVVDQSGGWLTVAPGEFRSEPMNRVDLAKIMDLLRKVPNPSIDQLAAAAGAGLGDPDHGMLPEMWLSLAAPTAAALMSEDWDMLRLYGSLSSDQLDTLLASKRLRLAALTEPQKAMLDRMIYGAGSGIMGMFSGEPPLHVNARTDNASVLGAADSMFSDAMAEYGLDGEAARDFRGEPTEVAPDGLPPATAITLTVNSSTVLQPDLKGKAASTPYFSQPMGVDQVASMVAMRDSPQFAQYAGTMPTFDHVKIGTQRKLHFRIYVSAQSFRASTLSDYHFANAEAVGLSDLPTDLQKKYDAALKGMRDAYKEAGNSGDGGGQAAPP